ncbi:discoidin domain-containing receptor 2-like isoform X2 [Apis florea]|uniref:discoidin domain-containing receptor 2-like isoform X2 n=1 Tax=Apis florea TaxID=7463 RepID=UPI0012FEE6D5|nr:discoidin domain-containing receptor 2-like isoform X2 [Apis florea]
MRSGSSTVSDEEEQVVGSPMAQVTANMPPLRPGQDLPLRPILIAVFVFLCSPPLCRTFDSGQCTAALGMENGEIPDEDISASSMYDPSLGPKHARLRQDKGGGAWCPKNMVTKEGKEYLEVNLHSPRALTSTRTQGRFGNGHGVEYTEEYFVEYWRPGFNKWVRWRNRRGMELLAGNNNPYSEKEQLFDPAIVATKIRFIPYTSHMRMVCIRVELYGCPWTGYEWVGWRNDTPSMLGRPVEITFEFDYSRNFTAIHLHMNNYFTKDVQVFSYAKVYLGAGGNQFNGEPVHFSYIPDLVLEQARDVTIKLHSRAGRFLKLQLYFAARWIMLSEVIFESVISEWNNTDDEEPRNKSAIVSATGIPYQNNEGPLQRDEVKATFNKEENNDNALPDKSKEPESRQFVGLVIGILTTVIVMLLAAITFIFYRNRRLKAALAPSTFYDQHGDLKNSLPPLPPSPTPSTPPPMSAKASSSMTSYSPEDMLTEEEDEVAECILDFPREKLNIVENLGCGYFGDVHICEVDRFPGYDEVFRNTTSDLVIVKSLRPGSSDALRIEFQEEAKRLARLADRNVARLLGASLGDDPMCIVLENGEYGDLNQYLQRHIAETSTVHTAKTLSFGTLIYMATQIASGMKHLEEMDLVHRDLATRNCLVSRGYTVKVCDLGSGRNAYAADYFRVEGRPPLPIRWMAWEAMLMGRHTSKSDVWSFAVTLWEILTFAREQPFEELPDHRIVENATYFYQEDDRRIILPLPKNCPKDIYELMRECWHRNDVDRPSFREIHMFLQRKNLGYKHADTNDT